VAAQPKEIISSFHALPLARPAKADEALGRRGVASQAQYQSPEHEAQNPAVFVTHLILNRRCTNNYYLATTAVGRRK